MSVTQDHDDFEGIDISGPWGGIRIGSGSGRGRRIWDEDDEVRRIRRRVRRRLEFARHVAFFVAVTGGLALIDWASGGGWWVPWLAAIWGGALALQFAATFVAPMLWGRDVEERLVQRELQRRRVRTGFSPAPRSEIEEPPAEG
jgi:hypothetical protein